MEMHEFDKFYNNYTKIMEHENLSKLTLKNYFADLSMFSNYLKTQNAKNINPNLIAQYREYLLLHKTSSNAVRRSMQSIRRFFSVLCSKELIVENYVQKIPSSPKKLDPPNPPNIEILTKSWGIFGKMDKDQELILARNQLLFLVIYLGGAKVNNISLLTWGHLFLDATNPRILIQEKNKKNKDPWSIPLPTFFVSYAQKLQRAMKDFNLHFVSETPVFFGSDAQGRPVTPFLSDRGIQIIFQKCSKEIKYELLPRGLRQAAIMRWIQQGHSQAQIKEWMGVRNDYCLREFTEYETPFSYENFDRLLTK